MEQKANAFNLFSKLSTGYDILFEERNTRRVEHIIINCALIGFSVHLILILLAKHAVFPASIISQFNVSYLKAIYTPFSIILFYEVLTLILILPKSIVIFIGKQFEIITLITIRSFFHDIANYDLDKSEIYALSFLKDIGIDLIGALMMFFFTAIFYRLFARTKKSKSDVSLKRIGFINIKKSAALVLSFFLLILSIVSLATWLNESYQAAITGAHLPNPNTVFYKDFFSAMIFVDVFMLILSFIYSSSYDIIFRNGGFVISTILVRIALTAEKPFNIYFALTSVLFGVCLMLLFVFYNYKFRNEESEILRDDN